MLSGPAAPGVKKVLVDFNTEQKFCWAIITVGIKPINNSMSILFRLCIIGYKKGKLLYFPKTATNSLV